MMSDIMTSTRFGTTIPSNEIKVYFMGIPEIGERLNIYMNRHRISSK